jgi:hypothetical protein
MGSIGLTPKERAHHPAERERRTDAERDADGRQPEAVPQKHLADIPTPRAERHADADLSRALCGDVGDDAVEPDDAEQQRHERADDEHREGEYEQLRGPLLQLAVERARVRYLL